MRLAMRMAAATVLYLPKKGSLDDRELTMKEKWFTLPLDIENENEDSRSSVTQQNLMMVRVEDRGWCGCAYFENRRVLVILSGILFTCAVSAIALLSVLVLSLDGFDELSGSSGTDLGSGLEYGSGSGSGYF